MKKITTLLGFFLGILSFSIAQIPEGYYYSAVGKSGTELRTALYNIIKDHTDILYSGIWNAYPDTDVKPNGKVWDIYSDVPDGTPPYEYFFSNKCGGSCTAEAQCYNREHTIPKSWFNDASPMVSDLFHIYPTDGWVNSKRANYPYGEVSNPTWTSQNGSKLGPCSYPGYTLTVFEPILAYKGDLARTYFYMCVRYMNQNLGQSNTSMFQNANLQPWALNMLIEWHNADPVSQKEIDRNNVIYNTYQHNRNPFIDCPELVNLLFTADSVNAWWPTCFDWSHMDIEENVGGENSRVALFPNPAQDYFVAQSGYYPIDRVEVVDVTGRVCLRMEVSGEHQVQVEAPHLKAGCYFVKVQTGSHTEILKWIKK